MMMSLLDKLKRFKPSFKTIMFSLWYCMCKTCERICEFALFFVVYLLLCCQLNMKCTGMTIKMFSPVYETVISAPIFHLCHSSPALHFVITQPLSTGCFCPLRFLNKADLSVSVKYHSKSHTDTEAWLGPRKRWFTSEGHKLHAHILF